MPLFDTLYIQSRACLGLDETDLDDDMIAAWGFDDELELELASWLPQYPEVAASPTQKGHLRLRVFCKYYVAALMAGSANSFVLKVQSDGANRGERFQTDWQHMAEDMRAKAYQNKKLLLEDLGVQVVDSAPSIVSVASPNRDPVTRPRPATSS